MNIFERFKNMTNPETDIETKYKLSEENAYKVIKEILDFYEIDVENDFDADYKKVFENSIQKAIKAVRLGRLEVVNKDGNFKIVQHMRSGRKEHDLEYGEIDGNAKLAMAGRDSKDLYGRIYEVMGYLSKLGFDYIKGLKGVDLSLCELLGTIFLAC